MNLLILFTAFLITKLNLFKADVQIDEIKWELRAVKYSESLLQGDLAKSNTYLTHPAFPTNILFGFGFQICKNSGIQVVKNPINCGRFFNSIIQFISFVILFKLLASIFDKKSAILGVLTVIFSPQLSSVGSIMHLDAFVGLTVTLSYYFLQQKPNFSGAVLAGISIALGCLTKISTFVFFFAQALFLLLSKRIELMLVFLVTGIATFHSLPSLWFETYRYSNVLSFLSIPFVSMLVISFVYFFVSGLKRKDFRFILIAFLPLTLSIFYLLNQNLFQNLIATFTRLFELPNIEHETKRTALKYSWLFKLTFIDFFCLFISIFFCLRTKSNSFYLSLLLAFFILLIPKKQSIRYFYPLLIIFISLGSAYISSHVRFGKLALILPLTNLVFFLLSRDCLQEFSNLRLFGLKDTEIQFPSCKIEDALKAIPSKNLIVDGDINLVNKVNRRAGLRKNLAQFPYLSDSNYLLTFTIKQREYFKDVFLLENFKQFGFGKPSIIVYRIDSIKKFPSLLPGALLSPGLVKIDCDILECKFLPKNKKIDFAIPLKFGVYFFSMKFQPLSARNFKFSISRANVFKVSLIKNSDSISLEGILYLNQDSRVKFQASDIDAHYGFFIDVLKSDY